MSRIYLFIIFSVTFSSFSLHAQGGGFNYANEVAQRASTPQSPEAAAFARYGDVGVNMYSGTPSISVPIYTHQGRELNLPINLSYDASGIRVHQKPTMVGLGWNLNVGGRISRQVNGLPDDYLSSSPFANYTSWYDGTVSSKMATYSDNSYYFGPEGANSSKVYQTENEAKAYLSFLRKVHEQEYETQPDYYNLSVMGLNDTFVFDRATKTPFSLDNPSIKISRGALDPNNGNSFNTFTVFSDNGTKYIFEAVEVTHARKTTDNNAGSFDHGRYVFYNSGWYLTRVESPLKKDIYEFEYANYINNRTDEFSSVISEVASANIGGPPEDITNSVLYSSREVTIIGKKYLSKIKHNGKVIVEMTAQNNVLGGPDAAINNITVYSEGTSSAGTVEAKTFDLNYSYFKKDSDTSVTSHLFVRLKLDEIVINDADNNEEYNYEFTYDRENQIPSLTHSGQDYLGFYNGTSNPTGLIRSSIPGNTAYPTSYGFQFTGSSSGANRNPNDHFATIGMLTQIKYPTGGTSVFEYEGDGIGEPIFDTNSEEEKLSLTLSRVEETPLKNDECNRFFGAEQISAHVLSDTFYVSEQAEGTHTISYTKTGDNQDPLLSNPYSQYVIIRTSESAQAYTWDQIYNNNCELLIDDEDLMINYTGSPSGETIYLEAGTYQVLLLLYDIGFTKNITVTGAPNFGNIIGYNTTPRAGVRVAKITDYINTGVKAKEKQYEYGSGVELTRPQLEYVTQERYRDQSSTGGFETMRNYSVLHRVPYALNGQKQHIAYPIVTERIVDFNDPSKSLTKTTHFKTPSLSGGTYNSGTYTYPLTGGTYSATQYSKNPTSGQIRGTSTTTESSSTTFTNVDHYRETYGVSTGVIGINNNLFPTIQGSPGNYRIVLKQGSLYPFFSASSYYFSGSGSINAGAPPECNGEENCSPEIARLYLNRTYAYGAIGGNPNTTEQVKDGTVISTTYTYTDHEKHRYPKSMTTTSGSSSAQKTVYTYPFEVVDTPDTGNTENCVEVVVLADGSIDLLCEEIGNTGNAINSQLENANMINQPVIVKQYNQEDNQDILTSTVFTEYGSNRQPISIYTAKKDDSLEKRMTFDLYDSPSEGGNLLQARQEDGTPVSFIWGYNKRYVAAKITNIEYANIPASYINNIQSYSNAGNTALLLNTLESLQNDASLSNSFMTYYTYLPNIGVNTMTDETGYRMSYFYDAMQRLERVEDATGNVLSENEYNYKN